MLITAGGPHYGPLLEMDADQVHQAVSGHMVRALEIARSSAATAALAPFTATLALELAPVRVNLIATGFVDTPLSASLLGDQLDERRTELRATLPIGRVRSLDTRAEADGEDRRRCPGLGRRACSLIINGRVAGRSRRPGDLVRRPAQPKDGSLQ
ncbi:SDR family oxidoreductase [Spirillospora sp. CA-128828]|uniref:SDR family oxidoreductase n=1 Tax=Spirillospora sp. CA-128828 TaxID=3240033 RepID=UPI003D8F5566